ncbi:MAG: ArsA family ATPase [Thermostichales cyanobacterium DRC_bins_46]
MTILDPQKRLILLSGKGGVGKTTLSSALSQELAWTFPERQFLLVSTDPAHSLGDIWQCPVGDDPRRVHPNLQVRALDAARLLRDFKAQYVPALSLIAERASWLEREDLLPLWDLSWPGVDELMALLEIHRLLAAGVVDTVILDTAPTGHTLRLLALPQFLENLLGVFQIFQEKHRALQEHFGGQIQPDPADHFLKEMQQQLEAGQAQLQDANKTAIWLVMLPEALSLAETQRFIRELQNRQLPLQGILVNQIVSPASPRFPAQQQQLRFLEQQFHPYQRWGIPWLAQEPLGSRGLAEVVAAIRPLQAFVEEVEVEGGLVLPPRPLQRLSQYLPVGVRLVICGGKGGGGKTTVAASLAWALANRDPGQRLLLVSIDPAHSLGDCLGVGLGQEPRPILDNLWAQEVDAEVILGQFRQDYLEEMVAILAGDGELMSYDALAWQRMLAMPPPGLDEIMALINVLAAQDTYDLIVVDSAPTGHLLRFLEMPAALEGWLDLALKLWLKYRDRIGRMELAQRLRHLRHQVKQLQSQLRDPQVTAFVPVFNPEQAVLAETQRLLSKLDEIGIPHPCAVVNRVEDTQMSGQQPWSEQLGVPVVVVPFHPDPRPQVLAAYV